MKRINGNFVLSETDVKRAAAHARRIARSRNFDGSVQVYFNHQTGEIVYSEFVGSGARLCGPDINHVYTAETRAN